MLREPGGELRRHRQVFTALGPEIRRGHDALGIGRRLDQVDVDLVVLVGRAELAAILDRLEENVRRYGAAVRAGVVAGPEAAVLALPNAHRTFQLTAAGEQHLGMRRLDVTVQLQERVGFDRELLARRRAELRAAMGAALEAG